MTDTDTRTDTPAAEAQQSIVAGVTSTAAKKTPTPRKRSGKSHADRAAEKLAQQPAPAAPADDAPAAPAPDAPAEPKPLTATAMKQVVAAAMITRVAELIETWSDDRVPAEFAAEFAANFMSYAPGREWDRRLPESFGLQSSARAKAGPIYAGEQTTETTETAK